MAKDHTPICNLQHGSDALDFASSRFGDGEVADLETLARYVTADLATTLEIEWWNARVGGREDLSRFYLRVTSTFRLQDQGWKLVHRHADPLTTPHADGPLRDLPAALPIDPGRTCRVSQGGFEPGQANL